MLKVHVPGDSVARAVGADQVVEALQREAERRNVQLDIRRTSSRGLYWLEPLLECDSEQGRQGFGPVTPQDVPGLLDAMIGAEADHRLALGAVEDMPYLKTQQRLLFARAGITRPLSLDDYRAMAALPGWKRPLPWTAPRWWLPCSIPACVVVAGLRFLPASSGAPCATPSLPRSMWCATPTKATPARLPTAC